MELKLVTITQSEQSRILLIELYGIETELKEAILNGAENLLIELYGIETESERNGCGFKQNF